MRSLLGDMRYGFRLLRKRPAFSLIAVLALALGIGANTAIFSVVDAVLLRPLPYADSGRLVALWERSPQLEDGSVAYLNFLDWKAQSRVFESLAARQGANFNLTGQEEPERLNGANVSAEFFPLLGVQPLLGRVFRADEDRSGAKKVAVISYGLWQRRFHGDEGILGRAIDLDGAPFTVIGVLPAKFRDPAYAERVDVYAAIGRDADRLQNRGNHPGIYVVGRLKPGETLAQARAEMDLIAQRLERQYPATNSGRRVAVQLLQDRLVRDLRTALLVVLAAVGFVLLIGCANVANLLLARAAERQPEIALRAALGAGRWQLFRQLLAESLVLALAGGACGLLLGWWGMRGLLAVAPEDLPRFSEAAMNLRVLGFTLGLSLATGLVFGSVPAWQSAWGSLHDVLKESGRRVSGDLRRNRIRGLLVVGEVALSLVLLIGAGLMLRSFARVLAASPGFRAERVLTLQIDLPGTKYQKPDQWIQFFQQVLGRTRNLPGVLSAATILPVPVGGFGWQTGMRIEGREYPTPHDSDLTDIAYVTPDYFQTMGIPLRRGRVFTEQDREGALPVAVIDEKLARTYFPDADPMGKRLAIGGKNWQIVGVVGHVKNYGVDQESRVETYLPFYQSPRPAMSLVVRTTMDPAQLAGPIRGEVRQVDPNQAVSDVRTMERLVADSVAPKRISALLLGIFAAIAVLLAAVGLYGVISYTVAQRTREIGIRMALGAGGGDVLAMVVKQALALGGLGMAIGLGGAALLTRAMKGLLFGISAVDPLTFAAVPAALALVVLAACYLPARRATRIDPVTALRYE